MVFRVKGIENRVLVVYGFRNHKPHYDLVLTLVRNRVSYSVHGFLSRVKLRRKDFLVLWDFLRSILDLRYLVFEALEEHAKVYKEFLPVIKSRKGKTFNGFPCEILVVDLEGEIKEV